MTRIESPSAYMLNNYTDDDQFVTYTTFDRTASITEGDYSIYFTYGPDLNRRKTELKYQGATESIKYYSASGYEKIVEGTDVTEVHYITCGAGLVAMHVIENGTGSFYYVYSDHLGSITAVSNSSGNLIAQQNFDAWGRKRNPTDWTYSNIPSVPHWLTRGFTGHEHLPHFDLINMNNRMYDPIVGRFLAVDNYVQDNTSTQGYNRYSYALNNPLKYTDPSGDITAWDVVAGLAIVGGILLAPATGGSSIAWLTGPGIVHFGYTAEKTLNGDMSWNEASDWAGFVPKYEGTLQNKKEEKVPDIDYGDGLSNTRPPMIAEEPNTNPNYIQQRFYASIEPNSILFQDNESNDEFPSPATILANYPEYPGTYCNGGNECAIRMSIALENSGVDISGSNRFRETHDHSGIVHQPSAAALADWLSLSEQLGTPTIYTHPTGQWGWSDFSNREGIIYFVHPYRGGDGPGHIDVISGGNIGSNFYPNRLIWFWEY